MIIRTELDSSALDHGLACREQAEAIRASIAELHAVAVVLGLSDPDGQPSSVTVGKLSGSLSALMATQDKAATGLDAMAEACDDLVEQRMVEGWEEVPHPAAMWIIETLHAVLLCAGLIAVVFVGIHHYRKWRDQPGHVQSERVMSVREARDGYR